MRGSGAVASPLMSVARSAALISDDLLDEAGTRCASGSSEFHFSAACLVPRISSQRTLANPSTALRAGCGLYAKFSAISGLSAQRACMFYPEGHEVTRRGTPVANCRRPNRRKKTRSTSTGRGRRRRDRAVGHRRVRADECEELARWLRRLSAMIISASLERCG
jgi:hypothetical protein